MASIASPTGEENNGKHETAGVASKLEGLLKQRLAEELALEERSRNGLKNEEPAKLQIAKDATELIGNTPLVYLNKIALGVKGRVAAKLEGLNPAGSVKDRIALCMIREAEQQGLLTPGKTILVESTSGNTGIGLAAIAALRGYELLIVMPNSCSLERRVLLLQLGAKLVLTEATKGFQGVMDKQEEVLKKTPNAFALNQFENLANPMAHILTTGPEIWRDTAGQVAAFVSAAGTAGTITGVSQYLKARNPQVHTVVVEPAESAVISGGPAGPHKIQGTGAGIIPPILDMSVIDEVLAVKGDDALATSREVSLTDGLLVGISSGAAIKAALEVANRDEFAGKLIVVLLPSAGERYLSTELYQGSRERAEALAVEEVYEPSRYFSPSAFGDGPNIIEQTKETCSS